MILKYIVMNPNPILTDKVAARPLDREVMHGRGSAGEPQRRHLGRPREHDHEIARPQPVCTPLQRVVLPVSGNLQNTERMLVGGLDRRLRAVGAPDRHFEQRHVARDDRRRHLAERDLPRVVAREHKITGRQVRDRRKTKRRPHERVTREAAATGDLSRDPLRGSFGKAQQTVEEVVRDPSELLALHH